MHALVPESRSKDQRDEGLTKNVTGKTNRCIWLLYLALGISAEKMAAEGKCLLVRRRTVMRIVRRYDSVLFALVVAILSIAVVVVICTEQVFAGNIHVWICKGEAYSWKDNETYYVGDKVFLNYEFTNGSSTDDYDMVLKYKAPGNDWMVTSSRHNMSKAYIRWTCNQVGTYYGRAELSGKTYGSSECSFNVQKVPLSKCTIIGDSGLFDYTGNPIKPSYSITYTPSGGTQKALKQGVDYVVSYSNNTNVGFATATISGIGDYTGSVERSFEIVYKVAIVSYSDSSFQSGGMTFHLRQYWPVQYIGNTSYAKVSETANLYVRVALDSELASGSKIEYYQAYDTKGAYTGVKIGSANLFEHERGHAYYPMSAVYPSWLDWRGKQRIAYQIVLANGQIVYPVDYSSDRNFHLDTMGQYSIRYDANGGSGVPETQRKYRGVDLKLSSQKPSRKGYFFEGWSEDKKASDAAYLPGGNLTDNRAMTLYAVWKAVTHDNTQSPGTWQDVSKDNDKSMDKGNVTVPKANKNEVKVSKRVAISNLNKLKSKYSIAYAGKLKLKIKSKGNLSFMVKRKGVLSVSGKVVITGKKYGTSTVTIREKIGKKNRKKVIVIEVVPRAVKIKKIKSKSYKITISISPRDKTVTGYQIYASGTKNFKKQTIATYLPIAKVKSNAIKLKMPKQQRYYIKIRAYKKVGKRFHYGPWSNVRVNC